MKWYYSPDGSQRHEASEEELASLARDGRLTGHMLLWRDGWEGWRPAREARPDLFGQSLAEPPPPPPPGAPASTPPTWGHPAAPYTTPGPSMMGPKRPADPGALTSVISGGIALVSALTGVCCCFGPIVSPIAAIIAIIYGHIVYGKAKGHAEAESDRNLALVGLILGYLALLSTVVYFIYMLAVVGIAGMGAMAEGMKGGFPRP